MGRYRKVDTRIWNDEKFRILSDDAQLLFFFLMTHPQMTSLGAMRATIPGLAAEKNWTDKRLSKALSELLSKGMVEHDPASSFICLPHFLKYNQPENPNVVKSWASVLDLIPEGAGRLRVIHRTRIYAEGLPEPFRKELPKTFESVTQSLPEELSKDFRIPVPEPEPFPPIVPHDASFAVAGGTNGSNGSFTYSPDFEIFWTAYPKKTGKGDAWKAWQKLRPSRVLQDIMLRKVAEARASPQWQKQNGEFIPNPATWLRQSRWDDEFKSGAKVQSVHDFL